MLFVNLSISLTLNQPESFKSSKLRITPRLSVIPTNSRKVFPCPRSMILPNNLFAFKTFGSDKPLCKSKAWFQSCADVFFIDLNFCTPVLKIEIPSSVYLLVGAILANILSKILLSCFNLAPLLFLNPPPIKGKIPRGFKTSDPILD